MRQVVVYVFYLWLALSFLYLVLQMVRKMTSGSSAAKPADTKPVEVPDAGQPSDPDPVATLLAEEAAQPTATLAPQPSPEPDTLRVPAEPMPTAVTDLDALPPPTVILDTSAPDAAMPMAAPTPTADPAPDQSRTEPRASLSSLLAGIRLPHDLMPVVPDGMMINDAHVSLLTSSAPAAVVGPAIADELERLGYRLEPKDDNELIARRDADELVLGIVTSPALLSDGGRPRYPSAAEGDVLITIDVAP